MHPNLVQYALNYAEKGFSVIPISATSKRPIVAFADKPPLTAKQIKKIWNENPTANIALRTTNFFVVDVDRHNGFDGMQSLVKSCKPDWFNQTLAEKTAHDGVHFYFAKPASFEVKQNIGILQNVDIKAHVNNYVLCAPSQLEDGKYEWINHKPMISPCKEMIAWLASHQMNTSQKLNFARGANPTSKTITAKLFETIIKGFGSKGSRNNDLTSFMGSLLYRNVDPEIAGQLALIANNHTATPLPEKELERTVNSMIARELRRRKDISNYGNNN